jgi:hypothetical protein
VSTTLAPGNPTTDTQAARAERNGKAAAKGQAANESQTATALAAANPRAIDIAAATLDDVERTRIAMQNRLRAMRDDHGLGDTKEYVRFEALCASLVAVEAQATKELERALKAHPLGAWVVSRPGVGLKQAGRLLAAVGDPAIKPSSYDRDTGELLEDARPRRGPGEFWQLCGHGDPARSRRRKGEKVQFNPEAKMRTHLIAESCVKHRCKACTEAAKAMVGSDDHDGNAWRPPHGCTCPTTHPYRAVYDAAKLAWEDRDVTDLHRHNHALRLVGKAVLRDLFLEARAVQCPHGIRSGIDGLNGARTVHSTDEVHRRVDGSSA